MKIYEGSDRDKIRVKDFSKEDDGDGQRLRAGLMNPGMESVSYNDIYVISMFNTIREIQNSISRIDGTADFRPWMLVKLLVCMVNDRGERERLLEELDQTYRKVLKQMSIDESFFEYESESMSKAKKARMDSFFWTLSVAILPIVGEVVSFLNLSRKTEVWES